jgi:two-component system sensor histidine kinase YesM
MQNVSGDNTLQTLYQVNQHVDTYMEELERLTTLPYYSTDVLNVLEKADNASEIEFYYQSKLVKNVLKDSMVNPREDLQGVYLYSWGGKLFFNARNSPSINPQYNWKTSYWYSKALKAGGKAVFLGRYRDDRILNQSTNSFSVARVIKSFNGAIIGGIVIDGNFNGLENIFNNVNLGENSNLVVLDQDNQIIFSKNLLYLDVLKNIRNMNQIKTVKLKTGEVLVGSSLSNKTGWKLVGLISVNELNRGINMLRQTLLLLSIVAVMIVGVAAVWVSYGITKPLRKLKSLMKQVQLGNYNVSMKALYGDEIGDVVRAFNKMSIQIHDLINQVLEVRYKQKEAELHNLKMQIRPHFLYNTLELIRAFAELKDNTEIIEMTTALGGLLRYSIKEHNRMVKVKEEMDQIKNYIKIQQIRLGDSFHVEYDVQPEVMQFLTIPIILQPIVENAFQHGLSNQLDDGLLHISCKAIGDMIIFEVFNNGTGIPSEQLRQINELLETEQALELREEVGFGIGLRNVAARIHLTFGEAYGVFVDSEPDGGTTVRIKIPRILIHNGSEVLEDATSHDSR